MTEKSRTAAALAKREAALAEPVFVERKAELLRLEQAAYEKLKKAEQIMAGYDADRQRAMRVLAPVLTRARA